jgi:hypothetical protein
MANRLVAAWRFSDEAEFYEQAATLGLRLALTAPGPACSTSLELVTRLDPAWLTRAWQGHPAELSVIPSTDKRLGDVALRAANLAAALGPAWDGDWWLDDVDVALFTIPTLDNPKDGDAAMRVLLAAYGQHVSRRPCSRRPSWLLFDEFSAVQGGRPLGHQHRGALPLRRRRRHPVGPVGRRPRRAGRTRTAPGLGRRGDPVPLPMPAELAALAGSERTPEAPGRSPATRNRTG